eukprot:Nitzschia sp. Nitz4//scaffold95_size97785//31826//33142//NITZ4_004661-RA/size97785-processed-gene-0.37-mRNA-1//-1//CDS//3329560454//936//frame0
MAMNEIQALLLASLNSYPVPSSAVNGSNIPVASHTQLAETFLKELVVSPHTIDKLSRLDANTQALCLKALDKLNVSSIGTGTTTTTGNPGRIACPKDTSVAPTSIQSLLFAAKNGGGQQQPWLAHQPSHASPVSSQAASQDAVSNQSIEGNLASLLRAGRPAILTQPFSSNAHTQCQTLDHILSTDFKPATGPSTLGSPSVVSDGSISHHMPSPPPNHREIAVGNLRTDALTKNQDKTASVTPHLDESESSKLPSNREKQLAANRMYTRKCRRRKKEYEENLKKENEKLRKLNQILEVAPDLIVSFDSSGEIRFVNMSSMEFLGMKPTELIGTSFWDILSVDSASRLKAVFMDSLAKRKNGASTVSLGQPMGGIMLKEHDQNSPLWSLRGSIYFPEDGAPECACTIHHMDYDASQPSDVAEPSMKATSSGPVKKRTRL